MIRALAFVIAFVAAIGASAVEGFDEFKERFLLVEVPARRLDAAAALAVMNVAEYDAEAIKKDRSQPEFVRSFWRYYDSALRQDRIDGGRAALKKHRAIFDAAYKKYNVPPAVIAAFWGMETNYGAFFGNHHLASALTTLAFDGRRARFFSDELANLIRLVAAGHLNADAKGSWAGAFGNFQFMPSSVLSFAIDGDGDGRIDLIGSVHDSIFSAANYLNRMGWNDKQRWGRPVSFAEDNVLAWRNVNTYENKTVNEWARIGIRTYGGGVLPKSTMEAMLIMPQGATGPAFLVYPNYRIIMRWNASTAYALSIGMLSDVIAGEPVATLKRPKTDVRMLSIDQLREMQKRAGVEPDGILRRDTLRAIKAYQQRLVDGGTTHYKSGRRIFPDGYPDMDLFEMGVL
ncbi:MAG: lytic murein transglycosylase [Alphaproteobacteria bacterium]|nr:lytic murein transglycosylase [Alphaproteobacteria bacterium]